MQYDVLVVGGGPAGAAASRQLARGGRRVLLLEREVFPRFHIGESLLPASNEIFRTLGLEDEIRAASFVHKLGASFATEDGERSSYIDFTACSQVPRPRTYQVLRSRFDQILLDGASAVGVEVRQGWRAQDVAFEAEAARVTMVDPDGEAHETTAAVVLDASGQAGFLAKRLGLRQVDPALRNVAVHAHFEHVERPAGDRSGDIRIVSCRDLSWIWFIPVSETVTSVGLVMSKDQHAARPREAAEALLDRYCASTPAAAAQMEGAKRVTAARFDADFCYGSSSYAGDRWLLAGDAGSFLDPVFSTGVLVALESGLEAAAAIDRALAKGGPSARAFAPYARNQERRYKFFRRYVRGFYDPAFRDLWFQTSNRFGLVDAMVSILAGDWRPPLHVRMKMAIFFGLTFIQRHVALAPRSHVAS